MAPYVDFQAHTVFHPILPKCPDDVARFEITECKADLERRYGLDIYAFSYPNGDCGEREAQYARLAGYQCALTVEHGCNDFTTDLFRLRRISVPDDSSLDELLVKVCGLWGILKKLSHRR